MVKALLVALAFALLLPLSALAVTAEGYSGPCVGGGNWLIVISYDGDGNVIRREGSSCGGTHWTDCCGCPGYKISLTRALGSSSTCIESGANWWVRFNVNSYGQITDMWGVTAYGEYWGASDNQHILN
ncbi:MAG: hypothetical protein JWQ98_3074 [Chlorobi bacterium]|nr:hypothetical protein [Chlorobiota bacterium]